VLVNVGSGWLRLSVLKTRGISPAREKGPVPLIFFYGAKGECIFNFIDRGKLILYFLMNFIPLEKLWLIG
jgi:hypothetical protein